MSSQPVHDAVRQAVRAMLVDSPAYEAASTEERKAIAKKLVDVGLVAARMLEADEKLTKEIRGRPPVAKGLDASDQLGMRAVNSAAQTVRNLRDSIAFPEFVQSLITGTFQAILTSSTMQLGSLGELLDNVSASASDFESTIPDNDVRSWAVQRFPFLRLREGTVVMGNEDADLFQYATQLRAALSATEAEVSSISSGDIEGSLLPLVRRKMGRDRQGIMATLVQMGLQRIVVDDGRLEASMDLRVDASSNSQEDKQALDSLGVTAGASASFGVGPWGASVQASTAVGRVRSDHQLTQEQISARAGLRSSVQLAFRTEQVPLDKMADAGARVRISQNARVPDVSEHSILDPMRDISGAIQGPAVPPPPALPGAAPAARAAAPAAPAVPAVPAAPRPPAAAGAPAGAGAPAAPRPPGAPGAPAAGAPAAGAPAAGAPAAGAPAAGAPAAGAPAAGAPAAGAPAAGAPPAAPVPRPAA